MFSKKINKVEKKIDIYNISLLINKKNNVFQEKK
jgi:hypothetical protein